MTGSILTHCGQCGYDLEGLGASGTCPECGHAYDKVEGRGIARRSRTAEAMQSQHRKLALLRTVALFVIAVMCFTGGLAVYAVNGGGDWGPVIGGGMVGLLFAMAGLGSAIEQRRAA